MKLRLRPHHTPRFETEQGRDDRRVTTLPVPGFRQARPNTCGFAAALMVLRYFGSDVAAMQLFERLDPGREGVQPGALVRELRRAGLRVRVREDVDFARIGQAVDRNHLIIGQLADDKRWLVIYGYGHEPRRVYVADPRPDEGCERLWDELGPRLGGYGIICSHPSGAGALRQESLHLGTEPSQGISSVLPPAPLPALRCEVRTRAVPGASRRREPAQLAFSFAFG